MTFKGCMDSLQCGKKYEFLNYIYLFENWESAKNKFAPKDLQPLER